MNKNAYARIAPITISVMILAVAISGMFITITDIVKADTITDITEDVGVCTAVIAFNYTDTTTNFRIYFNETTGISTSTTNYTYRDPDDRSTNQDANHRRIIVMGLTDETKYYYKIYDVTHSSWATTNESNFTTLPRFTNESGWQDAFYDTYLISTSSDIKLVQQNGSKANGTNSLLANVTGYHGYSNVNIHRENATCWYGWGINDSGSTNVCFFDSTDGIHWSYNYSIPTYDDTKYTSSVKYALFYKEDSNWRMFNSDDIGGACFTYYTGTSPNSQYVQQEYGLRVGWLPGNNECILSGIHYDTLGPSSLKFFASGQQQTAGAHARDCGIWYAFNETDWLGLRYDGGITDISPRDLTINAPIPGLSSDGIYYFQSTDKYGISVGCNLGFDTGADVCYPFLCTSRDKWNWTNFNDTKPIIPTGAGGTFDDGWIVPPFGTPTFPWFFTVNDTDYFYYGGDNSLHGVLGETCLGLSLFRKDGLTAVEPQTSTAYLTTISIPRHFTNNFTVNGNFTATSKLNISILDADTNLPFTNFDVTDFDTITTNSTSITPTWGTRNLTDIPDSNFKINFSWDGADSKLFCYTLDGYGETGDNIAPTFSTPSPSNETINVPISQTTWNISINDTEGDTFNWTIQTYPDIGSGSANGASNGTKEITINPLTNTTHTVYVNATDLGSGNWTNETFWFTTESIPTIYSINGPNHGVTSTLYRNLTWYKVNNTKYYQLQLSNTSDFTDLLYNVSNINSTTYGAEYYCEVGNYVYFNITNIFHNEIFVLGLIHYYRVRAYI